MITRSLAVFIVLIHLAVTVQAAEGLPGPVEATFISCYDGDTCRFDVLVWPGLTVHTAVRMRGVDTPEIQGDCEVEKTAAISARDFVSGRLAGSDDIVLSNIEPDKYGGRILADIVIDGHLAAHLLIGAGLGRPYDGGKRQSWCPYIAAR